MTYQAADGFRGGEPSIGEAFSSMFRIYFSNFWEFFVLLLIFQSVIALLNIINAGITLFNIPFIGFIFNIGTALLGILLTAGLIAMAAEARMKGSTTRSRAFSLIGKKALAIIVVNIIVGLIIMIGVCLCIIPGFFALVYLIWATIIVVVETADIGASIKMSTDFAKKHSPYTFILAYIGVAILVSLFQVMVLGVPQMIMTFGGLALFGSGVSMEMTIFLITVISSVIAIPIVSFFGPFLPIFITDYYLQAIGPPSEPMLSVERRDYESA
ncbi:MAG: hypothetical protein QCI82_10720 [Candidatus Thermoplasmatota archaeon]|nr:hypothetical protein [Candidatus Thermoplasmatota archaeon]